VKISIRPYTEADFAAVTTVWFESWESVGIAVPVSSLKSEMCERFLREVAGNWSVYVATVNTDVAGFVALQEDRLQQLFVAPKMQNRGVGKQLLDFVKAQRPAGFWLTTPTEGRAVRFYEREGFRRGDVTMHPRFGHEVVRYDWCPDFRR
jgi:GNAT superfamily N-acetyltransferase